MWLPPYAFERTKNWLTYVDPTTEALENVLQSALISVPAIVALEAPARFVNPGVPTGGSARQFLIGTKTNCFKSIVAGHNVINNPLRLAALYLEAVEEAYGVEIDFDTSATVAGLVSMLGLERKVVPRVAVRSHADYFPKSVAPIQENTGVSLQAIFEVIAEYAALGANLITPSAALEDLGVDSLSLIELKFALEEAYSVELDLYVSTTVSNVLSLLGCQHHSSTCTTPVQHTKPVRQSIRPSCTQSSSIKTIDSSLLRDPIEALEDCKKYYDGYAVSRGLTGFWISLRPKQDELVVAYVVEAFQELGTNLKTLRSGETVPTFQHVAKHSFLVEQLWDILTDANIVQKKGAAYVRASGALPAKSSSALLEPLLAAYSTRSIFDC